jgi:hypothetical protein
MARIGVIMVSMLLCLAGCVTLPADSSMQKNDDQRDSLQEKKKSEDQNETSIKKNSEKEKKPPKTLFEWAILGQQDEKEKKDENENGDEENKRLDPDRPHLPEAASTVGLGRVILESGYTYTSKGPAFFHQHSYPEALLRVGLFADWFEFRVSQNFINQKDIPGSGQPASIVGAQDLEIGVKLALTEQKSYLPEAALILQTSVPTGIANLTNDTVMPGVNLDLGWEIAKDRFGVETVTSANGARDELGHPFVNFVQGVTGVFNVTRKLEAFGEYDLFVPIGALGGEQAREETHQQEYLVGGFVYFINNNFEVDIRAGVGLNKHASDYLLGTGFAARY